MRIAVISDTHIPARAHDLPPEAWRIIEGCEAVFHAGDIITAAFLTALRRRGPRVVAVRGNNDHDPALADLPETVEVTRDGVAIAMVHDSGDSAGRRRRLRQQFPRARVVIFGHSHIPQLDDDGELMLLNPGSPTDRRRMPIFTMAVVTVEKGIPTAEIVDLGRARAT